MKYLDDEELQAIEDIVKVTASKSQIENSKRIAYKKVWTAEATDMRNRWIISMIVKKGMSSRNVSGYIKKNWGVSHSTATRYVEDALHSLAPLSEKDKTAALEIHRERLEDLYHRAVKDNRIESALKVLEQMAKINGYYNDTMVVNMPVMQFKFGDDDNLIMLDNGSKDTGGLQTV